MYRIRNVDEVQHIWNERRGKDRQGGKGIIECKGKENKGPRKNRSSLQNYTASVHACVKAIKAAEPNILDRDLAQRYCWWSDPTQAHLQEPMLTDERKPEGEGARPTIATPL